jgi:putative ABC transport system permease protein
MLRNLKNIYASGADWARAGGKGAVSQVQDQISSLGDNLIWVEAGSRNVNGVRTGSFGEKSLTAGDMRAIRDQVSLVSNVSPNVDARVQVVWGNHNWSTRVRGVTPEYLAIRRLAVESGSVFSDQDVDRVAKVCLLGHTVASQLFGDDDPAGKTVQIQNFPCVVSGVVAPGIPAMARIRTTSS